MDPPQMYASAVGTTVLQLREIPARPATFVGWIVLFNVAPSLNAAAARAALGGYGEIVAVDDRREPPVLREGEFAVRFASHESVESVLKAMPTSDLWAGLDNLYTDMAYDRSGWYTSARLSSARSTEQVPQHSSPATCLAFIGAPLSTTSARS